MTLEPTVLGSLASDYKTGLLSMRLLCIRYQMSESAILSIAATHKWGNHGHLRDAVDRSTMRALVDRAVSDVAPQPSGQVVSETQVVDTYGQIVAGVVESQRRGIERGRKLSERLLGELEGLEPVAMDENAINTLADLLADDDPDTAKQLRLRNNPIKAQAEHMKFIGKRIGMLGALSETQERYIGLEREAWGLNAGAGASQATSPDDMIELARQGA